MNVIVGSWTKFPSEQHVSSIFKLFLRVVGFCFFFNGLGRFKLLSAPLYKFKFGIVCNGLQKFVIIDVYFILKGQKFGNSRESNIL